MQTEPQYVKVMSEEDVREIIRNGLTVDIDIEYGNYSSRYIVVRLKFLGEVISSTSTPLPAE